MDFGVFMCFEYVTDGTGPNRWYFNIRWIGRGFMTDDNLFSVAERRPQSIVASEKVVPGLYKSVQNEKGFTVTICNPLK